MVIFHTYVSLPEGKLGYRHIGSAPTVWSELGTQSTIKVWSPRRQQNRQSWRHHLVRWKPADWCWWAAPTTWGWVTQLSSNIILQNCFLFLKLQYGKFRVWFRNSTSIFLEQISPSRRYFWFSLSGKSAVFGRLVPQLYYQPRGRYNIN